MPPSLLTFKTRNDKLAARKSGRIEGYFGQIARGRPKKAFDNDLPMNQTVSDFAKQAAAVKAKAKEPKYTNWTTVENFPRLREAVLRYLSKTDQDDLDCPISSSTIHRNAHKWLKVSGECSVAVEDLDRELLFGSTKSRGGGVPLLNESELELLNSTLLYRDQANNGMSRSEAVSLICELAQCSDRKKACNHLNYLVSHNKLSGLKRGGRVVAAQATTKKRSQIVVEQQLRWHTTVEDALQELRRLNQPAIEFEDLCHHFWGNLDETCFQANADGSVKVIASSEKKKTEKISEDCRSSITSLRIGMASGIQGPFTFLAKGVKNDRPALNKVLQKRCPEGSRIVMTPNAYMNDEVYERIVPDLCKGIRQMPVIKDYPNWWVAITLDGFGSHVNVHSTQQIFSDHKILIIKEEGDTSHVNQAYDQQVAKSVSATNEQLVESN